ncbi:hypothetical protein T03_8810 [Trichinella britovi]|uniref:Uncharacterized protein n=1 Tax=Trichinella britovi TaxID=45882 RepID=A0A0V1DE72_TRIBR|nr:hypothetical protein T03_8810 [Trichinella britovi]
MPVLQAMLRSLLFQLYLTSCIISDLLFFYCWLARIASLLSGLAQIWHTFLFGEVHNDTYQA